MHLDLPVRAKTLGIEVEIVHNASIINAVCSVTDLGRQSLSLFLQIHGGLKACMMKLKPSRQLGYIHYVF